MYRKINITETAITLRGASLGPHRTSPQLLIKCNVTAINNNLLTLSISRSHLTIIIINSNSPYCLP